MSRDNRPYSDAYPSSADPLWHVLVLIALALALALVLVLV